MTYTGNKNSDTAVGEIAALDAGEEAPGREHWRLVAGAAVHRHEQNKFTALRVDWLSAANPVMGS